MELYHQFQTTAVAFANFISFIQINVYISLTLVKKDLVRNIFFQKTAFKMIYYSLYITYPNNFPQLSNYTLFQASAYEKQGRAIIKRRGFGLFIVARLAQTQ